MTRPTFLLTSFLACAALLSCTVDAYEKGEGENSLLTAELVEATVDADKQVTKVTTDDALTLTLTQPYKAKWISSADTTYRALLYYNKVGSTQAEVVNMSSVGVLRPMIADSLKEGMKTDPLYVESIWQARNGRYINIRLRLLTGQVDDDDAKQSIGIVENGSTPSHARLQLYHDQGGQPEYYSSTAVISLPMSAITADTVSISINTYDGPFTRTFP